MTPATSRKLWLGGLGTAGAVFAAAGYAVNGVPGLFEGFVIGVIGAAIASFVWF
jgi:hypothetical protein